MIIYRMFYSHHQKLILECNQWKACNSRSSKIYPKYFFHYLIIYIWVWPASVPHSLSFFDLNFMNHNLCNTNTSIMSHTNIGHWQFLDNPSTLLKSAFNLWYAFFNLEHCLHTDKITKHCLHALYLPVTCSMIRMLTYLFTHYVKNCILVKKDIKMLTCKTIINSDMLSRVRYVKKFSIM